MASYRDQFLSAKEAERYDSRQYGADSYSDLLWSLEREYLASLIEDMRTTHEAIDYLDFAAGTGRVIEFMEDKVDSAVGIEISPAMIERANQKLTRGRMICIDITADDAGIEGRYDLITAFRFVLNAEPNLRQSGINALAKRLKDDDSILIFNNHGNLLSYKLLLWPLFRFRSRGSVGRSPSGYMTNREAHRIARRAGLEITKTMGYGFLSGRVAAVLPAERIARIERAISRSRVLRPFCVNQVYVAMKQR